MTSSLASSWPTVYLNDLIVDIQPGFASGKHNSTGEGIPHFRPMNITKDGIIDRSVLKFVSPSAGRPEIRLRLGDVVFNNTNSPELVGKTALFVDSDTPAFSNHMTRLRVEESRLDPGFLALRLHQLWREGWFAAHCNNHVSQASIGRSVLRSIEIELPPLEIQIAIRSLATKIDVERSSYMRHFLAAQRSIEQFRQAVLAAACSGRLTEDWRKANPVQQHVKVAVGELTRSRCGNITGAEPDDLELPELADNFVVTTVGRAAISVDYGTSKKATSLESGVPVLRMGNIQNGRLDTRELKYCPDSQEMDRLIVEDGDLLFNRTNSPELVGKSAVFRESKRMTFASYLIRVRIDREMAVPEFVSFWINSTWGRLWARRVKTDGVSQSNINGTKLRAMPIPLPPLDEQREIVRRVTRALDIADMTLSKLNSSLRRIDRSSQAVLAKAFRGELVA